MPTKFYTVCPYLKEEDYYYATDLADAFEKLDEEWKEKLSIKSGSHNISAFSQFCSIFKGRRLTYPKTPTGLKMATDMLLMIMYDNLLLIEQIGKSKEVVKGLGDFDNWADVTRTGTANRSKTLGDSTNVDYSESEEKTGSGSLTSSKASDDNSYTGEVTGVVPVNSLSKQTGFNVVSGAKAVRNAQTGVNSLTGEGVSSSVTHSSNTASDYASFFKLDSQNLVFKFWRKFEVMFYRT